MLPSGINTTSSLRIVLPYYMYAALSFLILTTLMFFSTDAFIGHYFNPKLLAITHIATLGWISMIILGALNQLLPVILDTELYSSRLAQLTFFCFAAGIILLVFSFWTFSIGIFIETAAILLIIAATLFLINVAVTTYKKSKLTLQAEFIITAGLWFWITAILGGLMAFNFRFAFLPQEHLHYLKLHAHIGIGGWFLLLIIGVASKLVPMFLLSGQLSTKKLSWAYVLINISILGFLTDSLILQEMTRAKYYFLIAASGILCFVSYLFEAYRKRLKKQLDTGMKQTLYSILLLGIPLFMGILITAFQTDTKQIQLTTIYGVSCMGFISMLILGQTYKTLPFILWLNKYKKLAGKGKIPLPKDLYSEKLANAQFLFFFTGIIILYAGIVISNGIIIQSGNALLMVAAILYNVNIFKMVFHKSGIETKI